MKVKKSEENGAFSKLDRKRQKAVVMLFENTLTIEEIAKSLNRSPTTLYKWKKRAFVYASAT